MARTNGGRTERYRVVLTRMWGDAKVMALSRPQPCGQALWFHLLTGEQTGIIPGLFRIGEAAFAEQLGWPGEGFREAFREVEAQGLAKADWKARLVYVPNALRHNMPASPNVVTSWRDHWGELPECDLKDVAWRAFDATLKAKGEAWWKAFREACGKPSGKVCGNQEQDQEQDQEQEEAAARALARAAAPPRPAEPEALSQDVAPAPAATEPGPTRLPCAGEPSLEAVQAAFAAPAGGARQGEEPAAAAPAPAPAESKQTQNAPQADEQHHGQPAPEGGTTRPGVAAEVEPTPAGAQVRDWWAKRWPALSEFRAKLKAGLGHPLAIPRQPSVTGELEAQLKRVGVAAAASFTLPDLAEHERRYGQMGSLGHSRVLELLRRMPSPNPEPAAAAGPVDPACAGVVQALRAAVRPDLFASCFAPCAWGVEGETLVITAPTLEHANALQVNWDLGSLWPGGLLRFDVAPQPTAAAGGVACT